MKKNLPFIVFLFSLIILCNVEIVYACSCSGRDSPCREYKDADALFVGTVSKIMVVKDSEGFSNYKAVFSVEENFKGIKSKQISVQTSTQGTACGYSFEEGRKYLVYAYLDEKTKTFETSICTRTRPLEFGKTDDEVEILRSIAEGHFQPRIYGTIYEIVRGIGTRNVEYWTENERKPLEEIKVTASKDGKTYESVSDKDGHFSIKNLESGKYKLNFTIPSAYKLGGDYWDTATSTQNDWYKNPEIEITQNDCPDRLTIETRVDGRIKGRVFDEQGNPVGKGFRVSLITESTANEEVGDIDAVPAYTDENGYYEFYGIPQGKYYLGINLDFKPNKDFPYPRTYFPNESDISRATIVVLSKAEKLNGMNLYLPSKVEEIEVKGKVTDIKGNPIKGAIVERYGLYYGKLKETDDYGMSYIKQPTFEGRVETDSNGEFTLKLLKGNKYRINSYLEEKNSTDNILESKEIDIEASEKTQPIALILEKPKKK